MAYNGSINVIDTLSSTLSSTVNKFNRPLINPYFLRLELNG